MVAVAGGLPKPVVAGVLPKPVVAACPPKPVVEGCVVADWPKPKPVPGDAPKPVVAGISGIYQYYFLSSSSMLSKCWILKPKRAKRNECNRNIRYEDRQENKPFILSVL